MKRLALLTLLLSGTAPTLHAEPWLTGDGWIALGTSTVESEDLWFGGDGTWRTNWDGLGLSFGAFGTLGREHETYAALSYSLGSTRYEIGNPRPAYDQFARPLLSDVMLTEALQRTDTGYSRLTDGTITQDNYLPAGASYQRSDMATSLHYVDDYDTAVLGLGGGWHMGDWRVEAALEYVDGDSSDANAKLQGRYMLGSGEMSGTLSYNEANDAPAAMELAYRHPLTNTISMTELVSVPFEEPEDGLALVGANIYLRGETSLDVSGGYGAGDGLASAALRFEF
ncbi:hypothetical protein Q4560_14475 [Celeribacter halophilus]|uniref:hypothetical protein n=1 Tax=Celeribacter halophilus TaxID=576117 RepID=UPI0026E2F444|nr:hypothetical protein [Celeribacter halophilus]MDO6724479.1 hypothetical protein [Celeribacter halophilus]